MYRLLLLLPFLLLLACDRNPYKQGAILYENFCQNCHMEDGSGLEGLIPPLANVDFVKNKQDQLACIIRYGLQDSILVNGRTYNQAMAGIPQLSNVEIGNIINYINHAWGNDYGFYPPDRVDRMLEDCER